MTNEELRTRLYLKMQEERDRYRKWLLSRPPVEIVNHACEYVARNDILILSGLIDLSTEQVTALLDSPNPLADICQLWFQYESYGYMADVWDTVRQCADDALEKR